MNKTPQIIKIPIEEKNWVENYLLEQLKKDNSLNSIKVALEFAKIFKYPINSREDYYVNRSFQNFWTVLLRLLRKEEVINYEGGIITKK